MLSYKHLHFIGIGGIGISALAYLALHAKKGVSGSDAGDSELIRGLKSLGATVHRGHKALYLPLQTELVVYSEAVDLASNPEILQAQELGIPCVSYFEALGMVSEGFKTIAVTGSHGKTTTTAMLGRALIEDSFDPMVIVGSKVPDFGNRNISIGKGEYFVMEACEYRRSFLHLQPFGMIILNCEPDHLDYYKDAADYRSAFAALAQKVPKDGFIVINANDKEVQEVVRGVGARVLRQAQDDNPRLRLGVPGEFNRSNALMALAAAKAVGADEEAVTRSLNSFKGTWRRMEVKGEFKGATIIDDYGHHPTEVKATLGALKEAYAGRRLICVFQPHQYSRTYQLLEGFKVAFGDADIVIVPNIYEARDSEKDKASISAEGFVRALNTGAQRKPIVNPQPPYQVAKSNSPNPSYLPLNQGTFPANKRGITQRHPEVIFGDGLEKTVTLLEKIVQKGDVVVTMGAGDVWKVGEGLMKKVL